LYRQTSVWAIIDAYLVAKRNIAKRNHARYGFR
jgi:hypothetical protein